VNGVPMGQIPLMRQVAAKSAISFYMQH